MNIHHIAIICTDIDCSIRFYTEVLNFSVLQKTHRAERDSWKVDLKSGDVQIELFSFPHTPARVTNPEASGLRHVAFSVPDLDAWQQRLIHQSIPTEEIRVDELTGSRFFFFPDPDGLPIELYEVSR